MNFPDLSHLRQLQKDLWQWPKSRASVMVGAGFSLNAEPIASVTTRFPTWRQLVRAMFDELHLAQPGETPEQVRAREERFNSANALRIASEYEAAFDRRKLELLIRTQTPDSDHQPGKLHHLLLQLPWADIFTTNYDTLLERTEVDGRTYQPVIKASELTTAFSPRIVKLHGSFPSQTPFIISEEDYRTYPRNFAPFVNSVQQSLLENSFVLIGFSGDDPNFLEWTGWIRDELGGNHAPIYLVGPLSLGHAERSLLARRGVTPIDLAPVFTGIQSPNGIHAASIEWFLRNLAAARPPRPEMWPDLERGSVALPESRLPAFDVAEVAPGPVKPTPDTRNLRTPEIAIKTAVRWKFERLKYPGWLVAEKSKRSNLWRETKSWIIPLVNVTKDWPAADRILLFREINWRLETALVPLFQDWIEPFEKAVNEVFENLAEGPPIQPSLQLWPTSFALSSEIIDGWFELAFGLLREARETYSSDRWHALKVKIDKVVEQHPKHADRLHYEAALWAMWNVERESAKAILGCWQPSSRFPLAAMWKAGLLAELDELGEARTILRAALVEIRRALRNHGQNIEILSLEGWCTYLIASVETSLDFDNYSSVRNEFRERWQELKVWDCSPWPHKEYFNEALSASLPSPQREEQKVQSFDPGQVTVSRHWSGDFISPYLPAFAYIRLYEQTGIPMRLPILDIAGETLQNACRWIAPFIRFWSPALLIRAGKIDALKKDDFLSRTRVAAMDTALAKRLYGWCLQILKREVTRLSGRIAMGSAQELLLEVLPEVLSRLAFKVEAQDLRGTFPLVLQFHRQAEVRSHIQLHEYYKLWFRRLFEAADGGLLLEWLPDLIRAPLIGEGVHPVTLEDHTWPDPIQDFPPGRGREAKDGQPDLVAKINEATDWLMRRAASESGEGWHRAIMRLIKVYQAKVMTPDQERRFGELLWSQRAASNLPDLPNIFVFSFLHLPAPAGTDVPAAIKNHIFSLGTRGFVNRDAAGRPISVASDGELPLIRDAAWASKPVVQLAGEVLGDVEWTSEESKHLYLKARDWWANDKGAFEIVKPGEPFGLMGADSVLNTLRRLGDFLARVVLPRMEWADEGKWQELLGWIQEIRDVGVFPTVALPYMLLQRPSEAEEIGKTIAGDLDSDVEDAVVAAAKATRHWAHLSAVRCVPVPPPGLLATLIERVIFRRKLGIRSCLLQLSYLIREQAEAITSCQAALLCASLTPWNQATILPVPNGAPGEFSEAERPYLRVVIGYLAGVLQTWHNKIAPTAPEPPALSLWKQLCADNVLPEIRRAFDEGSQLES